MKTGKKVMILLLIFVAAVIVYFIHPVGKKEEHGITEYTAMEKAKFPVLYATMGEREMAPVFGQTEERGVTADRGSLIVLPEDRKLKVRFAGTTKIQGLRYEIRSLDTEDLIERTQVTSLDAAINGDSENAVSAELLIQNLLDRKRVSSRRLRESSRRIRGLVLHADRGAGPGPCERDAGTGGGVFLKDIQVQRCPEPGHVYGDIPQRKQFGTGNCDVKRHFHPAHMGFSGRGADR